MKNFLTLFVLFVGLVFLEIPADSSLPVEESALPLTTGTILENSSDMEQRLEILSKDLKTSNFLTPRRNIQHGQQTFNSRTIHLLTKQLRDSRLKGEEEFCKVSAFNSYLQTVKLSSLLCRRGYHIYALRKIVI